MRKGTRYRIIPATNRVINSRPAPGEDPAPEPGVSDKAERKTTSRKGKKNEVNDR